MRELLGSDHSMPMWSLVNTVVSAATIARSDRRRGWRERVFGKSGRLHFCLQLRATRSQAAQIVPNVVPIRDSPMRNHTSFAV
jgi:hypothetical protein